MGDGPAGRRVVWGVFLCVLSSPGWVVAGEPVPAPVQVPQEGVPEHLQEPAQELGPIGAPNPQIEALVPVVYPVGAFPLGTGVCFYWVPPGHTRAQPLPISAPVHKPLSPAAMEKGFQAVVDHALPNPMGPSLRRAELLAAAISQSRMRHHPDYCSPHVLMNRLGLGYNESLFQLDPWDFENKVEARLSFCFQKRGVLHPNWMCRRFYQELKPQCETLNAPLRKGLYDEALKQVFSAPPPHVERAVDPQDVTVAWDLMGALVKKPHQWQNATPSVVALVGAMALRAWESEGSLRGGDKCPTEVEWE